MQSHAPYEIRQCEKCKSDFKALVKELKRGNARFCSRSCATSRPRVAHTPNVSCAYCGKPFYKNTSAKTNSKSGLFFCCREHKDKAQCVGGIAEIQPIHYGTGFTEYRKKAFKCYPHRCTVCGYQRYSEALVVHHKDRNRKNCHIENLEILCPTCHIERHLNLRLKKGHG